MKMKKTITLILALLMLTLTLASCQNGNVAVAPEGMKLASGDDVAYNLFVPDNWQITNGYGTYGGYTSDAANINVSTYTATDIGTKEPEGTTDAETTTAADTTAPQNTDKTAREQYIDAYWDMCWKTYIKELNGFSAIEVDKKTELGGLLAKQYVYTAKYEGVEYKMQMTVTYSGGLMYILTYTAKAENYDAHLTEVEKIISEFKFK